ITHYYFNFFFIFDFIFLIGYYYFNFFKPTMMESIFSREEATKDSTEFLIRVSFIEDVDLLPNDFVPLQIFKEEVFDLLDQSPPVLSRGDGVSLAKPAGGPARVPIQIRETTKGR
ncbi:Kinesin-like protein KIN-4C, partial [Camellia lanceoleosa]